MAQTSTVKLRTKELSYLLKKRNLEVNQKVQEYIDSEVLRLCDPRVPMDTGALKQSGIKYTKIGSGKVIYRTPSDKPYARKMYYGNYKFNGAPVRGNFWFEKMKRAGGKESILRGAIKIAGART